MPRIYCCFIHFILFFIIPLLNEVEGVYTGFTFPVCPSMDRTVSAVYLPQYYSYILSPNVRRCVALWVCEKFQNLNFGNFFKFAPFTLSYVHVVWMLKVDSSSMLLLKQILIFRGDTSSRFDKRRFRVRPKLQLCIFWHFFNCTFSPSLCGDIKDRVDSFLLQSLWVAGNSTCWCILTTLRTD